MTYPKTLLSIATGKKFLSKYGSTDAESIKTQISQHIKDSILAASGSKVHGIMPIEKMLAEDSATLALTITRDGDKIGVFPPVVNPPELTAKYVDLAGQVSAYLNRYPQLFRSYDAGYGVSYHNFRIDLVFGNVA